MQILWPVPLSPLFRPIAALSLAWNGYGVLDFLMTQMRMPFYIARLPAETMPWIDRWPLWAMGLWALAVWAGLAGSVLLLLRSRHALAATGISLAAALAGMGWRHFIAHMPPPLATPGAQAFSLFVLAIAVLLCWYAWRGRRLGWLQ